MSSRRAFLLSLAASAASAQSLFSPVRRVAESGFDSSKGYDDPFHAVEVDVLVTGPDGVQARVPAFWAGGRVWKWRYSASQPGVYRYRTEATDTTNAGLHGREGQIEIDAYEGGNELYRGGALQVSDNARYLRQQDGGPFFWLADTWWMALTERLRWPEDFQELAADRVAKGFNVVQLVAGLYPDMPPFDPRGANEAGFPWEPEFKTINPAWWDLADLRIRHLVEVGLLPCILGCWGYYLPMMGAANMRRHWRYIIARWGGYPVAWCLAGEGSMPWYLTKNRSQEQAVLEKGWTEMAVYVRRTDPFGRLISIHPSRSAREVVTDPAVLDFDMLQTGHGDYRSIPRTVQQVTQAYDRSPPMPVIEAEVCYEGIMQTCREDIQRFMFWTSILNGCCGFTYGANGIWQVNLPNQPYGPSPHGRSWGDTPWIEAMKAPGGAQVGIGARVLRGLDWQEMTPHPDWISPRWTEQDYAGPSAAGIPGRLRVHYVPNAWDTPTLKGLEPGVRYEAELVNPSTGEVSDRSSVVGDAQGDYRVPTWPQQRDWVLVLKRS